jgi:hypothetical protein
MVVVVRCAACGSSYRMHERLAGKKARCLCGEPLSVPAAVVGSESPPQETKPEERPGRPASPAPRKDKPPKEAVAPAPSSADRDKSAKRRARPAQPLGTVVGVLSICYGGLLTVIILGGLVLPSGLGPIGLLFSVGSLLFGIIWLVLTVTIALGGVLIVIGHEHGAACAGVASGILCIFGVLPALGAAARVLSTGSLGGFLLVLIRTAVAYGIPICITVWCIRDEMAKEENADERG